MMSSPTPVFARDVLPLSPPRSPEPFPSGRRHEGHRDSVADTIVSNTAADHRRVSLSAPVSPTNSAFSASTTASHHHAVTLATSTPIPVLVSRPCSSTPSAKFAKHAVYRWAVAVRTPRHAILHLSKSPALCLPGLAAQSLTLPPACAIAVVENDRDLCGPVPDLSAALVLESPHASFLWELRSDSVNVDAPVVEPTKQILADWPLAKVVAMAATPDSPLVFSPPLTMSQDDAKRVKAGKRDRRMSTTAGGRRRSSSASVATMVDQGPIIVRALRAQDAHSMAEVLSGRHTPASVSPPPPFPIAHLSNSPSLVAHGDFAARSPTSPVMSPAHPVSPITPTIPRRGPESIIGAAAHYQRAVSPAFPSPPFSPRMGNFGGSPAMPSTRRPSGESTVSGSSSGTTSSVPNSPTIPQGYLDHPSRGRRPSTQYPTAAPTSPSPSLRRRSLSVAAHMHSRQPSFSTSTDPSPPLIPSHDAAHLLMASPPLTPPMSNTHSPALPDAHTHAHAHGHGHTHAQEDLVGELRRLHLALGSIQSNHMRVMARRRPSETGSAVGVDPDARDARDAVPSPPPRSRSVGPAVNQREAARALMSHFHGAQGGAGAGER